MSHTIQMSPIGHVVTGYERPEVTPPQATENFTEPGRVVVYDRFADGLDGLADARYAWLLTWLHAQDDRDTEPLRVVPRGLEGTGETRGVYATRTPNRHNRIGLSLVQVESVRGNVVEFRGVDLVDGTPVLDIKPWSRGADIPPPERALSRTRA
jgi:tRNA-Thr(GGU) m(6)t(6)A37 methyltransferase TsaA